MIRKSVREFPPDKHIKTGQRLARIDQEFRQLLATLRGSSKTLDTGLKVNAWIGRLRNVLDSQLLKDFPESYSASIYHPETESAPSQSPQAK